MIAFILAGGFATRLWPLTEHRAKPLLPLLGKPIIEHLLTSLPPEIPVVVSTNSAFEQDFTHWASSLSRPIRIITEHTTSEREKLGALGALAQWIEQESVDEDVLVLTGDNYCGFSLESVLRAFDGVHPLVIAKDLGERELARAFVTIVLEKDGKTVNAFEEKPQHPRSALISTGCSILPASTLPFVREYAKISPDNLGGIFEELLRRAITIQCCTFSDPWFDIGSFQAYIDATKALLHSHPLLDPTAKVAASSILGSTVLGRNAVIINSTLTDCVLFDDCTIEDCVLTNCIIADACHLRGLDLQGKMIRKETKIIVK